MKLLILFTLCLKINNAFAEVNVYSDRPAEKMAFMAQAFEAETGIKVNPLELSASEMMERMDVLGANDPADVLMVKDMVYLNQLSNGDYLQPLNSQFAQENVDPSMQSEFWTAITYRARTLVYNKSYDVSGINTYADLAKEEYAGTLCLRTSDSSYNEALAASLIGSYGLSEASDILDGWLNNLTTVDSPFFYTSDRDIIGDIADPANDCQLGMTNTYYLGLLLLDNPDLPVAVKFLNLKDGGASTNGIGAGVSKNSQNPQEALQFIEFMLSSDMQQYFATANQDFPANVNEAFPTNVENMKGFSVSPTNWVEVYSEVPAAKELFSDISYL